MLLREISNCYDNNDHFTIDQPVRKSRMPCYGMIQPCWSLIPSPSVDVHKWVPTSRALVPRPACIPFHRNNSLWSCDSCHVTNSHRPDQAVGNSGYDSLLAGTRVHDTPSPPLRESYLRSHASPGTRAPTPRDTSPFASAAPNPCPQNGSAAPYSRRIGVGHVCPRPGAR